MPTAIDLVTVGSLFVELTPSTPGETLMAAHAYTLVAGGAAANVVFALARLGIRVGFLTAVGDDDFGTLLTDELATFGVDTRYVRRATGQLTPVSFCAIDGRGGKRFSFYRFPARCAPMETLTAADFRRVTDGRLFDFSEGSLRDAQLRPLVFAAARAAHAAGVPVLYAVNLRTAAWQLQDAEIRAIQRDAINLADIVVLNQEEVAFITGTTGDDGLAQLQSLGPRVVVVTCGGDAAIRLGVGAAHAAIAPFHVPVIYDVGAGDTFHAGLVAAALQHDLTAMALDDWTAAVRFAAATAAIRVSTSADPHALPTYDQVMDWLAMRG